MGRQHADWTGSFEPPRVLLQPFLDAAFRAGGDGPSATAAALLPPLSLLSGIPVLSAGNRGRYWRVSQNSW